MWPALVAAAALLVGCGFAAPSPAPTALPDASPTSNQAPSFVLPSTPPSVDHRVTSDLYRLADRSLYMTCSGTGPPTVIYFHPFVTDRAYSGIYGGVPILERLQDRVRVCLYDRANVGQSGFVDGPLTGESSVADLHALLAAAGEPGPFVLLGSGFGGLIAGMYATAYPRDVAGMVLLDPSLPDEQSRIAAKLLPPDYQLLPTEWRSSVEQLDRLTTYSQAEALIGTEPTIPVTLLASNDLGIPPEFPVADITSLTRQLQQELVDRFGSGQVVLVDSPGFIEQSMPDRVASEVFGLVEGLPR